MTTKMADNIEDALFFCQTFLTGTFSFWFLVAANIFLFITSTSSNILILIALHKSSSLHPPSKILLRSLAIADLCVGFVLEPVFVAYLMSVHYGNWKVCFPLVHLSAVVEMLSCVVSLLTMTAISVDRLFALSLGVRYRQIVTSKRVALAVLCLWTASICASASVYWTFDIIGYYGVTAFTLGLTVSTCCYAKIYQKLLHHQVQLQGSVPGRATPLNIARYRKTVSSALWVYFTLVVCYLPAGIVTGLVVIHPGETRAPNLLLAWVMTFTLSFLNSTLNPVVYCWKITELRETVKATVRQMYR